MPDLSGQSIGRYHLIEKLGEGGMAVVYKAFDTRLEREVAVKLIRTEQFPPAVLERVLKRFEREAKALARLDHLHIVKIYDYGEHDGVPYLVMQYVPGKTLRQRTGKPLPYGEAARLLAPIARALEYAHQRGMVHRDVKPANVLITASGEPVLTDFGITKILEAGEGETLTGTGVGVGTPEYMAPEQWLNRVTPQSDIYALGVVLYELVTGRKPYTADTPAAVLLKQASEPLPRPRDFVPDLPERVERVLFKALAKQAENRYASMAEFAAVLEGLAGGQTGEAPPPVLQDDATNDDLAVPLHGGEEETNDDLGRAQPEAGADAVAVVEKRVSAAAKDGEEETRDEWPTGEGKAEAKRRGRGWLWAALGAGVVLLAWMVIGGIETGRGDTAQTATAEAKWAQTATERARLTATAEAKWAQTATERARLTATAEAKWAQTATERARLTATAEAKWAQTATERARLTATPQAGEVRVREADGMEMVYVPAGVFWMGSEEGEGDEDEHPRHEVYLDAYWIDRTEVTNAKFAKFVAETGYRTDAENAGGGFVFMEESGSWEWVEGADWQHPRGPSSGINGLEEHAVVQVSWNDAAAYCQWAGGRLPSEAEWEKAARGTDGRKYPWGDGDVTGGRANFADRNLGVGWADQGEDDGYKYTAPVGSYPEGASPYGALDMAGNVWEWVADWYDANYYANSPRENPKGPSSGEYRVLRGGSWLIDVSDVRAAGRDWGAPSFTSSSLGFRCALGTSP
ncbi:MAG: SUMF1/EgtB/PvdO family nonheme iron enzyme [Anaerolineae bacterium]|nr:SUMF1/EgtB/PvdO family nonheme iron enzyme [Anaerolineae bacterium]